VHVQIGLLALDPSKLDGAVHYVVDEARPKVEGEPGCLGFSVLTNAEVGVVIVESFWVSGDALREAERIIAPVREEAARRGAGTVSVERFEVVSSVRVARPQAGGAVRLTRVDTPPARVDEAITAYEDTAVPWLTEADGFTAALVFADRRTGRSISETLWRDREALAASRAAAAAIRVDAVAATGSAIRAVEEYLLAFNSFEPA
jgi:quinol monooxygenase YgiN